MILINFVCACVLLGVLSCASAAPPKIFSANSYEIEYPSSWTHSRLAQSNGTYLEMFVGLQERKAIPYCHIVQMPLDSRISPQAPLMGAKERLKFFLEQSNRDLLLSLYPNLASAQNFRVIHTYPGLVGKNRPGFVADFSFSNPDGFFYRVRAHYTFWKKAELSIWCQATSKQLTAAEDVFLRNLQNMQSFAASVQVKE